MNWVHRCGGADIGKHRKIRGNKSTDDAEIWNKAVIKHSSFLSLTWAHLFFAAWWKCQWNMLSLLYFFNTIQIIVLLLHFNYIFALFFVWFLVGWFVFNSGVFLLISPEITTRLDTFVSHHMIITCWVLGFLCSVLVHGTLLIVCVSVLIIYRPFMFQWLKNWFFVLEMKVLLSVSLHLCIETVVLCSLGQYYVLCFLPAVYFSRPSAS